MYSRSNVFSFLFTCISHFTSFLLYKSFSLLLLAEPLGEVEVAIDMVFSPDLNGLAIVLSSGRVAFVSGTTAKLEPKVHVKFSYTGIVCTLCMYIICK